MRARLSTGLGTSKTRPSPSPHCIGTLIHTIEAAAEATTEPDRLTALLTAFAYKQFPRTTGAPEYYDRRMAAHGKACNDGTRSYVPVTQ